MTKWPPPAPRPFVGLMGQLEMEAALEVIVAKAKREGVRLADVRVLLKDFPPNTYEADGYNELRRNGWFTVQDAKGYSLSRELVRRVHSVMPGV